MIVMFKLTPAQKQIALSIVERLKHPLNQPEADQMDNYLFLGNLRGYIPRTPETSIEQKLFLTPSGDFVRYEGQRDLLHKNGFMEVLKEISEGNIKKLRFVQYDFDADEGHEHFFWHQSTEDFIKESFEVRLLNWLKMKKVLSASEREALKLRIKNSVGLPLAAPIEYGTLAHRKMDAAGTGWKMKLINHAHKLAAA